MVVALKHQEIIVARKKAFAATGILNNLANPTILHPALYSESRKFFLFSICAFKFSKSIKSIIESQQTSYRNSRQDIVDLFFPIYLRKASILTCRFARPNYSRKNLQFMR